MVIEVDRRWVRAAAGVIVTGVFACCAVACNNPGETTTSEVLAAPGGSTTPTAGSGGTESAAESPEYVGMFASSSPQSLSGEGGGSAGGGGSGGTAPVVLGPPYGTSVDCGDAIVGPEEECDDGPGAGLDACTADCKTRDQPAVPAALSAGADRYLGAGRHPIAGLDAGFAASYVELDELTGEPKVSATLFDIWGKPVQVVEASSGAHPVDDANPVVAALPGGAYAVAWSDFDGDGSDLGVALRRLGSDAELGPLRAANAGHEFSQLNPDMLWTGSQLVVAWEDYSDPFNGPDIRYRSFDGQLNPTSGDLILAAGDVPEAAVALATFNGGWAAAYREGLADGSENIVVQAGDDAFRVGPVLGGPPNDRPALVELDATHLLVVFSGTDLAVAGTHNVPRIRFAVVDTAGSLTPTSYALNPLDDVFTLDTAASLVSPAVAEGSDGIYVSWRAEARSGDAAGDQIWLKYLTWDPARTPALEVREQEMLIPRVCEGSIGDQRTPALARVGLPPAGALAIAWDDYSRSQGTGEPDVVVHYAPTHERDLEKGSVFAENWTAVNGAAWPSRWTADTTINGTGTVTIDVQNGEGRTSFSGTSNSNANELLYVNSHTALNVEMVTKVRFNLNGALGALVARRADSDPDSYLAARIGTGTTDVLRLYAVVDNVRTDIQTQALPFVFSFYAQGLTHWLKFRAVTNADNSISLSAKFWLTDLPEPAAWMITATVPANLAPTSPLYPAWQRLATRAGRFGVLGGQGITGRSATFDDFRSTFFEGSLSGNPSAGVAPVLPLLRGQASYRTCTAQSPCTTAEGCCSDGAECEAGLACSGALSELLGLGSHAKTCAPDHCTDRLLNADEPRADCGGIDCAPCSCTSVNPPGSVGYCSATCPCGVGQADCATNADCLPGLICAHERGYKHGWEEGSDVCLPQHCLDRVQNGDETGVDIGNSCGNVACGSPTNGGYQHCTPSCPCPRGEGDCDYKDECQGTLACGAGAPFGVAYNVCVAAHCTNSVMDADETGINCGGADCGPICP